MKILLISAFFPPDIGGIPNVLNTLLPLLIQKMEKESSIYLLTAQGNPSWFDGCKCLDNTSYNIAREYTQSYYDLGYRSWDEQKNVLDSYIRSIIDQIAPLKLDAIISFTDVYIANYIGNTLEVPAVNAFHGIIPTEAELRKYHKRIVPYYSQLIALNYTYTSYSIHISRFAEKKWSERGLKSFQSSVIYNPFDLKSYSKADVCPWLSSCLGIPANAPILLYPQRLKKLGMEFLFQNLDKILCKFPDLYCVICGIDDVALLKEYHISEKYFKRIRYKVFSSKEMKSIYKMAAVTCLVCQDGFGMPAIESLASGTPVVATDNGPFNEILEDNASAFFYADNDLDSFISKLKVALDNYENQGEKISLLTQKEMKQFSAEYIADQYLMFINSSIKHFWGLAK